VTAGDPVLLTIVLATGAGLVAHLLAHRLRIPAIVPLLAVGVILGSTISSAGTPRSSAT
jgi:Kef-type K+ transport system membrane component KefB